MQAARAYIPTMTAAPSFDAPALDADVLIVGGGLIGPATALALAEGGLSVLLIDALPVEAREDPEFDGRAYSVSLASRRFLEVIGVWPQVDAQAQPVARIEIEGDGPASGPLLHFDHAELDQGPASSILEDRFLRRALLRKLDAHSGVAAIAPAEVVDTRRTDAAAEAELADGTVLRAPLLIACDGGRSPVAARAGIRRTGWTYDQEGLVCALALGDDHAGVARQRFLPGGPFAVLPLPDRKASIVWSDRAAEAERISALPDDAYLAEIARRLGRPAEDLSLIGRRWRYPLRFGLAADWVRPRLALVGDAAHSVHPIAGQGFNLGIRDAAALAETVVEARRRGEDLGALDVLERYQIWRRFETTALALSMDAMNRVFCSDLAPLRLLRDAGLSLADRLPSARRAFMRQAAGLVPGAPRMLRGEAL
ncbi:MAG: UbiH/UbiF/VisC/COQ6 family ubiquinone biosynthesis hydroxylase [Pseudomonadota bacterium]